MLESTHTHNKQKKTSPLVLSLHQGTIPGRIGSSVTNSKLEANKNTNDPTAELESFWMCKVERTSMELNYPWQNWKKQVLGQIFWWCFWAPIYSHCDSFVKAAISVIWSESQ